MNDKKIFNWKAIFLLALIIGLVVSSALLANDLGYLGVTSPSGKVPKINKDNASQTAQKVFEALTPGSKLKSIELIERRYGKQLLWEALSDQDGEVQVNAINGEIKFVLNMKNVIDVTSDARASHPLISKESALQSVRKIAKDLQLFVPDEEPDEANLLKHSDNKDAVHRWYFKWAREEQGFEYHDDWVFAYVDAYKGKLIGYNKNYVSYTKPSLDIKIKEAEALELAKKIANKNGYSLIPEKSELMIVNPNYRWTDNFVMFPEETRLAWIIHFSKLTGIGEIWIDASTREMLGGDETK
ncbi:MAG: hypothetical protein AB1743_03850 [Actinomycetota bacterium]